MKEGDPLNRRDFLLLSAFAVGGLTLLGFNFRNKTKELAKPPPPPESISSPENPRDVSIILTGDVLLGRTVMTESIERGNLSYPFDKVGGVLRQADLVFINLENPVVEGCPKTYESLKFCTDPVMLEGLTRAGVDVVNLANNHTLDYGEKGLEETKAALVNEGIDSVGREQTLVREVGGTKFGFLGFNLIATGPKQKELELIRKVKKEVDVVLVAVHWGREYSQTPSPEQKIWARQLIEAGADVIAGSHPHVVQEWEYISGKPVFYSLGNFIFDQMDIDSTKKGLAVRLIFREGKLVNTEELPTYMSDWARPEFTAK